MVLVSGEAGIGKTSLLRTLAAQHRADGGDVWSGLCDPLHTPQPLGPLMDMDTPFNEAWLRLVEGPRQALFTAVLDALRASAQPVLFLVEDVHWADEATLDLLCFMGRRVQRVRALIALSYRDDEIDSRHPLRRMIGTLSPGACTRLCLPRLTPDGVDALARSYGRPSASVHAISGGNPFFANELLRSASPGVPTSVQDLVLARYATLPPGATRLADLVAVMPGRAECALVEKLLDPSPDDIDSALCSGLLQADARSWQFRHELARLAVEDALAAPNAQALHAAVLSALVGQPGITAARWVHHAVRAHDRLTVARVAPIAAQEAAARGAYRESVAQWRTAIDEGEPPDETTLIAWLWRYAQQSGYINRTDEARATARRLVAMAHARNDVVQEAGYLTFQAMLSMREADLADALVLSERAVRLFEGTPATLEHCRAGHIRSAILLTAHRVDEAAYWAQRSSEQAQALGTIEALRMTQRTLAVTRLYADYAGGWALLEAVHDAACREDDKFEACLCALNLGELAGEFTNWSDGVHWMREALALTEAHDWDHFIIFAQAALALCLVHVAQWAEAGRLLERLVTRGDLTPMMRIVALLALCRLRLRRGDPGVDELLAELEPIVSRCGTLSRLGMWACLRAEVAAQRGDAQMLRKAVAAALPLAVERRHACVVDELRCHALALEDDGRFECAGDVDWRSVRAGDATIIAPDTPYALEADGFWKVAAQAWRERSAPYEEARALSRGDGQAQRRALAIFDGLGARPAADALRRRLREAGARDLPRVARPETRRRPCNPTATEFEVLGQLAAGLRNAEIAQRLHRSVRTVEHHVTAVLVKLDVESRHQAVSRALREGWLPAQAYPG
jgi:DNA-binding CsgD family transcriptional regulator